MRPGTAAPRLDNTLQRLEDMHESAKDQKSIRIPEGQRLKLDGLTLSSVGASRRRPKPPPPKFKLTFADLGGDPSPSQYDPEADDDDNEDWPDIHDLLNAPKATIKESSSDYSNSEIDGLIRDIPLDEFEAELADDSHLSNDFDSRRSHYRPTTPPPSRKRPREPENEPPTKQFDTRADTVPARFVSSPPISQPIKVRFFTPSLSHGSQYFAEKAKQGATVSR